MSIYKTIKIRCDECGYEEPNDYYFGVRNWIFIDDLQSDETLHFCSEGCLNYQAKEDNLILTNRRDISNNNEEFKVCINS